MFSVDFVVSGVLRKLHHRVTEISELVPRSFRLVGFIFHFSFSILAHTIELDYQELLITEPGAKRLQDLGQWAAVAPLLLL